MIPYIDPDLRRAPSPLHVPRHARIRAADEALQRLVVVATICTCVFLVSLVGLLTVYIQTRSQRIDCPAVQPLTKDAQPWPRKLT